jgi:O-antigen/teichoic acid export membrane protein
MKTDKDHIVVNIKTESMPQSENSSEQSFKKDFFWNTIGTLAWNALNPILLIIVTRINGIDDSGIFSFTFSFAIMFSMIGMYGGRLYQISDINHQFSNMSYIFLRVFMSAIMIIVCVAMIVFNHYDFTKGILLILLTFFKITDAISDAIYAVLQIHSKLYINGRGLVLKTSISLLIFFVIDLTTHNIILSTIALPVLCCALVFIYDLPRMKKYGNIGKIRDNKNLFLVIFHIAQATFWVFLMTLLSAVLVNVSRYFIDVFAPNLQGFFGILILPMAILNTLIGFIINPINMNIIENAGSGNIHAVNIANIKMLSLTLILGIFASIIAWLYGVPIVHLLFNIDISQYRIDLLLVIVNAIFWTATGILQNTLIILRYMKSQVAIFAFCIIILVILSIVFIPQFEMHGAMCTYLAASIIQTCIMAIVYVLALRKLAKKYT